MSAALVVWACLLLINGEGWGGVTASTQQACEEMRQTALSHEEVIASSVCVEVTVEKK